VKIGKVAQLVGKIGNRGDTNCNQKVHTTMET